MDRSEPVVLIDECGTGKSHLATGLCLKVPPCLQRPFFTLIHVGRQKRRIHLEGNEFHAECMPSKTINNDLNNQGYYPASDLNR
jgi:hypothetical protein